MPRRRNVSSLRSRALNVGASRFADLSCYIAFDFCMLRPEPREVAHEVVKNQDLSVASGAGTYTYGRYRDGSGDLSGCDRVDQLENDCKSTAFFNRSSVVQQELLLFRCSAFDTITPLFMHVLR